MEVHVYEPSQFFVPCRLLTLVPVGKEFTACIDRYSSMGYIVVLSAHGRTGRGSHVDGTFNQLSGWRFSQCL